MIYKMKKLGGEFEIEGTLKEIIQEASLIKSIPDICPLCGGDVQFHYRTTKEGHEYFVLKCSKCHATKNFGQHNNDKKTLYLSFKTPFEIYRAEGINEE